jgi:hypothetical protein
MNATLRSHESMATLPDAMQHCECVVCVNVVCVACVVCVRVVCALYVCRVCVSVCVLILTHVML